MKRLLIFSCLLAASCARHPSSGGEGWRQLFNGKDMDGWKMTGPGEFKLEEGCLAGYGGMGLLWYEKEKFGNCEIKVVFKLTHATDNSGVYVRIQDKPDDPWYAVHHGYEAQICNSDNRLFSTGSIYSFVGAAAPVVIQPGEWVTYIVRLEGNKTVVTVNGTVTAERKEGDPAPPKRSDHDPDRGPRAEYGYIGIQNHDESSKVIFKEISVRPLKKN